MPDGYSPGVQGQLTPLLTGQASRSAGHFAFNDTQIKYGKEGRQVKRDQDRLLSPVCSSYQKRILSAVIF